MSWGPLLVSLRAAGYATAITVIFGVALGYLLAKGKFPGRRIIEAVLTIPMVLPPTVTGFYLLTTMKVPWIEQGWQRLFGSTLAFTFPAIVVAATVESLPYCLRASRAGIASVEPRLEQVARSLGLSEPSVAWRVTIPLAGRAIAAGAALGFARALGDFAATLFVGGSFQGRTLTLPIAVFDAAITGNNGDLAFKYSLVLFAFALSVLFIINRLGRSTL